MLNASPEQYEQWVAECTQDEQVASKEHDEQVDLVDEVETVVVDLWTIGTFDIVVERPLVAAVAAVVQLELVYEQLLVAVVERPLVVVVVVAVVVAVERPKLADLAVG
jgi:hypothetical protein